MELGVVMDALYESEINCSVSTFWDGGFIVQLGDDMNGFVAEKDCRTATEAAEFLDRAAREHFFLSQPMHLAKKNGSAGMRPGRIDPKETSGSIITWSMPGNNFQPILEHLVL
jgi:hypothetical protein